jgi:hypothetical protein
LEHDHYPCWWVVELPSLNERLLCPGIGIIEELVRGRIGLIGNNVQRSLWGKRGANACKRREELFGCAVPRLGEVPIRLQEDRGIER